MTSLWRHLWPNYNTLDFKILTQCVKLLGERVLQVWWWYLHWFRRYCKKTRGGARNSPPPSGARVKRAKQKETDHYWQRWRDQRNKVTNITKYLRNTHIKNKVGTLLQHRHSPHKYHSILKSMIGHTRDQAIPPLIGQDGTLLTDNQDKAALLNEHFAKQSCLDIADSHTLPTDDTTEHDTPPKLNYILATEREVLALLNSLNPNKSCGPDKLPTKLLKMVAILIYEPLTKLFNLSLTQGIYPSDWKKAIVHPIFKNKGSSSDVNNYRPISLLSCVSKVFEKIVFDRIYKHITKHSLITEKQSGYRPGHNTQMQLVHLTHNIYQTLDKGLDFTAIFLDISKYFDKIWHTGLLKKNVKLNLDLLEPYSNGWALIWNTEINRLGLTMNYLKQKCWMPDVLKAQFWDPS